MNKKLDLKGSMQFALLTVAFNLVFSIVTVVLIYGWLLPNLSLFSKDISDWYYSGDLPALQACLDATYHIVNVLSLIPSTYFAYRSLNCRRKEFIKKSKGLISYGDGLKMHTDSYGFSDAVVCCGVILAFALAALIFGVGNWLCVFPLAYTLFSLVGGAWGPILGLIPAAALMCAASPLGVLMAQRKWRARYFIGE